MKRTTLLGFIYPAFLIIILITILIITLSTTRIVRSLLYSQTEIHLKEVALVTRSFLNAGWLQDKFKMDRLALQLAANIESKIRIYDKDRELICKADYSIIRDGETRNEMSQAAEAAFHNKESSNIKYTVPPSSDRYYYALPIYEGGELLGVIEVSLDLTSVDTALNRTYAAISVISLFLLISAMILSYYISQKIDRPLKTIVATARRYRDFDFSPQPYIKGPKEIHIVSQALKSMSESLKDRIQQVTRRKQELRAILSGMSEAVIVLDKQLSIREINPAALKLIRCTHAEAKHRNLIQVVRNSELYDFATEALKSTTQLEKTISLSYGLDALPLGSELAGQSPAKVYLQVHASLIETEVLENGLPTTLKRVVLVMNDITRLKNLENMRKDFVANVSHELKTPITSIKGFTETLLEGALDDQAAARRFISIIRDQSERLVAIIEDLLSLSRLEQYDSSGFEIVSTGVATVIHGAAALCRPRAAEKNITIVSECPGGHEFVVNATLIEQALVNLIDNAIKYSSTGSQIQVRCTQADTRTCIEVEDNGPGIPGEDVPRIFERFYRVDKTRSRDMGGTGLGLAIVKHIVLAHGGEVHVNSRLNEGSVFSFSIP